MSGFAAWGLTLLGLAVITTVAEMLLPKGKTRKAICSVSATIAVLVMITPLPELIKNGFDFDFGSDVVAIDENYIEYIDGVKADMLCSAAKKYIKAQGYEQNFTLEVELDGWDVKSARIKFYDFGMTGEDKHIYKSEIIKLIAEYFGIGEEAVMAYG